MASKRKNKNAPEEQPELAPVLDQPESTVTTETVVTFGEKDEFDQVEDVDLAELSKDKLDISDIPNAMAAPEKPKRKQRPVSTKKDPQPAHPEKEATPRKARPVREPGPAPAFTPKAPVERPAIQLPTTGPLAVLLKGIFTENALLTALVGICPAAAVAFNGANALAMGVCAMLALIVTNLVSSLIGDKLPKRIRAAILILLAAGATAGEELALGALLPDVLFSLGVFLPLISVAGLTLWRDDFAASNTPGTALLDAVSHGVGFTLTLLMIGVIREIIGSGTLFGLDVTFGVLPPAAIFTTPVGGLLTAGLLAALIKYILRRILHGPRPVSKDKEVGA